MIARKQRKTSQDFTPSHVFMMLSTSFFPPSPGPTTTTTTYDHFQQFSCSCDKTILLEISVRDRSCFLWSVVSRFLFGRLGQSFPEGIIKPYDGTSLTIGNRPIAVVQSVTVFRLILATFVKN